MRNEMESKLKKQRLKEKLAANIMLEEERKQLRLVSRLKQQLEWKARHIRLEVWRLAVMV